MIDTNIIEPKKEVPLIRTLHIDPGTQYTGYALFEGQLLTHKLIQYGLLKVRKFPLWSMRSYVLNTKFLGLVMESQPHEFVLEFPQFQSGHRGESAAREGSIIKLAALCGLYMGTWMFYVSVQEDKGLKLPVPNLVEPTKWKGQLTKAHTAQRCEEYYNIKSDPKSIENNFTDAIMMGHYTFKDRNHVSERGEKVKRVDY